MLRITDTRVFLVGDFEVTILEVAGCLYTARADHKDKELTLGLEHLYTTESEAFWEITNKVKSPAFVTMIRSGL